MKESSSSDDTKVSLTHIQASRYHLMRRLDQQFLVESKWNQYDNDITRLSSTNKVALASIEDQERRLKEMQAMLRSSSVQTTCKCNDTDDNKLHSRNISSERGYSNMINNTESFSAGSRSTSNVGWINSSSLSCGDHAIPVSTNYAVTTSLNSSNINQCNQSVIEKSTSQLHEDTQIHDTQSRCLSTPSPPTNTCVAKIRHNSFTVVWDAANDDVGIFDYEITYNYLTSEGNEKNVMYSCSKWCLKDPVPRCRFVVQDLEPETEYRSISIRCRNILGWSEFSKPIESVCTADKADDYENRREKFLYRINCIHQTIESLDERMRDIPREQVLLAREMANTQDRILELNVEIERVVSHNGDDVSSRLSHGTQQKFTKPELKRKLQDELVKCRKNIATWRADIINMDAEMVETEAEIDRNQTRLNERKAALLKFEKQYAMVATMKQVVSKHPNEIKRYYLSIWRSRVNAHQIARKILESFARTCRRRICAEAWRRLYSLVPNKQDVANTQRGSEPDGIGGVLLNAACAGIQENLANASSLVDNIVEMTNAAFGDQYEDDWMVNSYPMHLLCEEDNDLLKKGGFLCSAGHNESSLKCFELVATKMGSPSYFSGMSSIDAATLHSFVNGKIGQLHYNLGSWNVAIVFFDRQLMLAEDLDVLRTCALLGLGLCYYEKSDFEYAYGFFHRALDLCLCRDDKAREKVSYSLLRKCYENLNQPAAVACFEEKLDDMRDTRKERVSSALEEMNVLKQRLIDVTAKKSRAIKLQTLSPNLVILKSDLARKKQTFSENAKKVSKSKEFVNKLRELEEEIKSEIKEALNTKNNTLISRLVQGSSQEVKTTELLIRLEEKLKIVHGKQQNCLSEVDKLEMLLHNTKDDISVLEEEIMIENSLMRRLLEGRKYRCIALNVSNTASGDVAGSRGGAEYIALSEGKEAYIHNMRTGKSEIVFSGDEEGRHIGEVHGHTSAICTLFFHRNRVYTGSMDSFLICWDILSNGKVFMARGHTSSITCIHADDIRLVSGSADKSIIIWNKNDGSLLRRVNGHARGVQCIQCGTSWCVSASYETILCWNILCDKQSEKIKGVNCHSRLVLPDGIVTALQYGELEVVTGDSVGNVSVWWIKTGELLKSCKAHNGPVSSLQVDATKAVSCGHDMIVQVVDIIKGEVLQTLRGHTKPILAVAFDRNVIISASSDGEIREWLWRERSSSALTLEKRMQLLDSETDGKQNKTRAKIKQPTSCPDQNNEHHQQVMKKITNPTQTTAAPTPNANKNAGGTLMNLQNRFMPKGRFSMRRNA